MLDEFDVTVISVVPSYDRTTEYRYKTQKYYYEEINGVNVIRVKVLEFTKESIMSCIKNIVAYFFGALGSARKAGKQDYMLTISLPPIFGALLGV